MIEESYVSFETAKMLKEEGFDVPCTSQYTEGMVVWNVEYPYNFNQDDFGYSRPTQALAARWLREVHRIGLEVTSFWTLFCGVTWQYFICNIGNTFEVGVFELSDSKFSTYEEAFEEGLKRSLELIKK